MKQPFVIPLGPQYFTKSYLKSTILIVEFFPTPELLTEQTEPKNINSYHHKDTN